MPYKLRTFVCKGCGVQVSRRVKADAAVLCTACGVVESGNNARQIHARSGPYWDRWLAAGGARGRPRKNPDGPDAPPAPGRRPEGRGG